jgi:hypothetical protein
VAAGALDGSSASMLSLRLATPHPQHGGWLLQPLLHVQLSPCKQALTAAGGGPACSAPIACRRPRRHPCGSSLGPRDSDDPESAPMKLHVPSSASEPDDLQGSVAWTILVVSALGPILATLTGLGEPPQSLLDALHVLVERVLISSYISCCLLFLG